MKHFPTVATQVAHEDRNDFFTIFFGGERGLDGEREIRDALQLIGEFKQDAHLNFFSLTNGAFYVAPVQLEKIRIVPADTQTDGLADAVGIAASLIALSRLFEYQLTLDEMDRLGNHYHDLREFALTHAQTAFISKTFASITGHNLII